ncbi:hypothetical protein TSOC_004874 [Tetrabaena socialis]|uniref:ABM domain-containing protein n=1 Tax=Tetrabaena socialis TaxID=47790 RepID=A0A2J8A7R0_9CHLO|nr:hypothetical protein TSOC_004874 [Tetrabaena socialis]|eukprot:PNH08572.1 hypothetical protein TSOC_004874 [Tetrabaena socialis]
MTTANELEQEFTAIANMIASTRATPSSREATAQKTLYVAMNVFKVKPESAVDFENMWKTRESRLKQMTGFVRFAMLKCENVPGKYVSQTYSSLLIRRREAVGWPHVSQPRSFSSQRSLIAKCKKLAGGGALGALLKKSKEDFENWTNSSQFQASHGGGSSGGGSGEQAAAASKRPNTMAMLEAPPSPEFYSSVTITE